MAFDGKPVPGAEGIAYADQADRLVIRIPHDGVTFPDIRMDGTMLIVDPAGEQPDGSLSEEAIPIDLALLLGGEVALDPENGWLDEETDALMAVIPKSADLGDIPAAVAVDPDLLQALLDAAAKDPMLRQDVIDTPEAALRTAGIALPPETTPLVHQDRNDLVHIVLPDPAETTPSEAERKALDELRGEDPLGAALEQASWDADWRARLVTGGEAALSEAGVELPDDLTVKLLENGPGILHLVLPPPADGAAPAASPPPTEVGGDEPPETTPAEAPASEPDDPPAESGTPAQAEEPQEAGVEDEIETVPLPEGGLIPGIDDTPEPADFEEAAPVAADPPPAADPPVPEAVEAAETTSPRSTTEQSQAAANAAEERVAEEGAAEASVAKETLPETGDSHGETVEATEADEHGTVDGAAGAVNGAADEPPPDQTSAAMQDAASPVEATGVALDTLLAAMREGGLLAEPADQNGDYPFIAGEEGALSYRIVVADRADDRVTGLHFIAAFRPSEPVAADDVARFNSGYRYTKALVEETGTDEPEIVSLRMDLMLALPQAAAIAAFSAALAIWRAHLGHFAVEVLRLDRQSPDAA